MDIKSIRVVAEKGEYDDALAQCEKLLLGEGANRTEILRTKAYILALSGVYNQAVKERELIIQSGEATIDDYFLAANNALSSKNYERASAWLNEVLRLGEEQNEAWFTSSSLFLLAYSQMEQRQFSDALLSLARAEEIEPGCAMPLPGMGMCDHESLKGEIRKRREQEKN